MKLSLTLLSLLLSYPALARELPVPPQDCAENVASSGFCSSLTASNFKGPIRITFFAVVDEAQFPEAQTALDRYLDFKRWPEYIEASGSDSVVFKKSMRLPAIKKGADAVVYPHYYSYEVKSPIGYQKVRGFTHNRVLKTPYDNAEISVEFIAQTSGKQSVPNGEASLVGVEGVKSQTGAVHAVRCLAEYDFCQPGQQVLIYETTIQPKIELLPKVAGASIASGIEALLIGMLYNSN